MVRSTPTKHMTKNITLLSLSHSKEYIQSLKLQWSDMGTNHPVLTRSSESKKFECFCVEIENAEEDGWTTLWWEAQCAFPSI